MKFGQKKETNPVEMKHIQYDDKSEAEEPEDLNSLAFSVTKNPSGGYALVTVAYNPVTMKAKVKDVKRVSDNREEAEYYFRVRVGEYFGEMEANS